MFDDNPAQQIWLSSARSPTIRRTILTCLRRSCGTFRSATAVWKSGNGLVNGLLGGWQLATVNSYTSGSRLFATTANTLPFFNIGQRPDLVSGNIRSDISMSDYDPNDPARNTYILRSCLLRRNPVNTATRLAHWKCGPMRFDESFAVFKQTKIGHVPPTSSASKFRTAQLDGFGN